MTVSLRSLAALVLVALAGCTQQPADQSDGKAQAVRSFSPSFDCDGIAGGAQSLVCSDAELAALDREMARLYDLASTGPNMSADREAELKGMQQVWLKGRDGCAEARDPRYCLFSSYSGRINELRMGYKDARADDAAGISTGPMALACDGSDFGVGVSFLRSDPGGAFVLWEGNAVALRRLPDVDAERYAGDNADGAVLLARDGENVELTLPGDAAPRKCRFDDIG